MCSVLSLSLLLGVAFNRTAQAATSFETGSSSGASNIIVNGSQINVYAGLVGSDCSNPSQVCDNCASASFAAPTSLARGGCNSQRVSASVTLTLAIKSDDTEGYPTLYNDSDIAIVLSPSRVSKGSVGTISAPWATICNNLLLNGSGAQAGADCGVGAATTAQAYFANFRFGFSANPGGVVTGTPLNLTIYAVPSIATTSSAGEWFSPTCAAANALLPPDNIAGACDFTLYPGDGKAWITDLQAPNNFPLSINPISWVSLRFFYVKSSNFADLQPNSDSQDIGFSGGSGTNSELSLASAYVDGLENAENSSGVYSFMMASIDQAGNVGFFTDITDPANRVDRHQVTPSVALGILDKQFNCFIATAAYGSPFQAKVKTFRDFRDQYLLPTSWGRKLVALYYRNSPPAAHFIAQHDGLRWAARIALWPAWLGADLLLRFGLTPILIGLVTGLAVIAAARLGLRRRRSRT